MLSVPRRSFLSLTAATAISTALTAQAAQAATSTVTMNGNGLKSGVLRFTNLGNVTYSCPFAQSFLVTDKTFTKVSATTSDALVEATFTTAKPSAGNVYTRVIARRTTDRANFYSAIVIVESSGKVSLAIERVMNKRSKVIGKQALPFTFGATATTYELSFSVRQTRLSAQINVAGRTSQTLVVNDNTVPATSTPAGSGTGLSVYAGRKVPSTHVITATAAKSGNWGEHRGSTTAKGWGKLIFEDDFNTGSINTAKWRVRDKDYVSYDAGVNLKEAVTAGDSSAKLWLKKLSSPVTFSDGKQRPWGTGYLDTYGKFSVENFRLEYRAKQPASTPKHIGVWCGVWLRPDNTSLLSEIDVSESYGYASVDRKTTIDPTNRSEGTVHFGQRSDGRSDKQGKLAPVFGQQLAEEYHVWAVEKTPAGIKFFFDGVEYSFVPSTDPRYKAAFPAGTKFNIRLCMQAGNRYWGGPAASTSDCALEVDYVRVWQYAG